MSRLIWPITAVVLLSSVLVIGLLCRPPVNVTLTGSISTEYFISLQRPRLVQAGMSLSTTQIRGLSGGSGEILLTMPDGVLTSEAAPNVNSPRLFRFLVDKRLAEAQDSSPDLRMLTGSRRMSVSSVNGATVRVTDLAASVLTIRRTTPTTQEYILSPADSNDRIAKLLLDIEPRATFALHNAPDQPQSFSVADASQIVLAFSDTALSNDASFVVSTPRYMDFSLSVQGITTNGIADVNVSSDGGTIYQYRSSDTLSLQGDLTVRIARDGDISTLTVTTASPVSSFDANEETKHFPNLYSRWPLIANLFWFLAGSIGVPAVKSLCKCRRLKPECS